MLVSFFVFYEVVGLIGTESHQNNTYLRCWYVVF